MQGAPPCAAPTQAASRVDAPGRLAPHRISSGADASVQVCVASPAVDAASGEGSPRPSPKAAPPPVDIPHGSPTQQAGGTPGKAAKVQGRAIAHSLGACALVSHVGQAASCQPTMVLKDARACAQPCAGGQVAQRPEPGKGAGRLHRQQPEDGGGRHHAGQPRQVRARV